MIMKLNDSWMFVMVKNSHDLISRNNEHKLAAVPQTKPSQLTSFISKKVLFVIF